MGNFRRLRPHMGYQMSPRSNSDNAKAHCYEGFPQIFSKFLKNNLFELELET